MMRRIVPPAVVVALALVLGLSWVLRGEANNDTTSPADAATALIESAGTLVVFSEFGDTSDTIYAANPDDPTQRTPLAQVPHATGFGIFPSLSPDGTKVAYTVATTPVGAEAWVLDVSSNKGSPLASNVDLRATPVWAPDSGSVVVRRSAATEGEIGRSELLRVDLGGDTTTVASANVPLYSIDFSPDGATFYFAELNNTGSDLARVPSAGGAPETIAHVGSGAARDWSLSPDGAKVSYLNQTAEGYVAQVLDIRSRAVDTPLGDSAAAQFGPVWQTNGSLTVGRLDSARAAGGAVTLDAGGRQRTLLARSRGFDVPLSWSRDGGRLALRAFDGVSVAEPGPSWVYVLGSDGARHRLSDKSDVVIAGWMERAR